MSLPRRVVRWALQPAAERAIRNLQKKIADRNEENRQLDRKLGAATERANGWYGEFHKANQLAGQCADWTCEPANDLRARLGALSLTWSQEHTELLELRLKADKLGDALQHVTTERDQALARVVELEELAVAKPASPINEFAQLLEQQAERDRNEIERLEQELRTLAADLLEASGRLADLEEQRSSLAEAADYAAVLEAERESHAETRARLAELEGLLAATTSEER